MKDRIVTVILFTGSIRVKIRLNLGTNWRSRNVPDKSR